MEQCAMRILTEELQQAGVSADQLQALSKGAPIKVAIARCLGSETTMPLNGSPKHSAWVHGSTYPSSCANRESVPK